MPEDEPTTLPTSTDGDKALTAASILTALVPWVGGAISEALGTVTAERKLRRVYDVLQQMNDRIRGLESDEAKDYVQTDEFHDLVDTTLRQAQTERSEEKRKCYGRFLARDINYPGKPYDEKLRILRTLEELQEDHLRIIQAMRHAPNSNAGGFGSLVETLHQRLPDMPEERIKDLGEQLTDMKVALLEGLYTMMTSHGAQELRTRFTPYGTSLLEYILEDL